LPWIGVFGGARQPGQRFGEGHLVIAAQPGHLSAGRPHRAKVDQVAGLSAGGGLTLQRNGRRLATPRSEQSKRDQRQDAVLWAELGPGDNLLGGDGGAIPISAVQRRQR
jgi:hypothetical protein